jgi:hypothetical protein
VTSEPQCGWETSLAADRRRPNAHFRHDASTGTPCQRRTPWSWGSRATIAAPNHLPPNPDKYADELLDAYLFVEDADALFAEYGTRGVEFTRGLANTPWDSREFVVKDCDGRLLAFGAAPR